MALRLALQEVPRLVDDHRDGHLVLHAPGDHDVRNIPLWLDVFQEGRFHEREPLFDSAFDGPSSLTDIANDLLSSTSVGKD